MPELRFFTHFIVYGKCALCKQRIESITRSVEGVSSARWDLDTQTIHIEYDHTKVTPRLLKMEIAAAGHDTDEKKASDQTYESLPDTCKYRLNDT